MSTKNKYYISVCPWAVYVKEAEFFESQDGLTRDWGKSWLGPIEADSIAHARELGNKYRTVPEGPGGVL